MVVPIFNTHYSVHKFDRINEFGVGSEFKNTVDRYLNHNLFNQGSLEQQGNAITTVKQATEYPLVQGLDLAHNDLGKWILETKSQAARELKVPVKDPNWFMTHRHSPWIPHAVAEHKATDYRTSFIFEFTFMDMPIYTLTRPTF